MLQFTSSCLSQNLFKIKLCVGGEPSPYGVSCNTSLTRGILFMEEEIWKDVAGWEGKYQVSSLGNVRGIKRGKILKKMYTPDGYHSLSLCNGKMTTKTVHRLVAQAFIPNPENKPEVNHKNHIRTDNRAENLEWNTHIENIDYTVNNNKHAFGERHSRARLKESDVIDILTSSLSNEELAVKYGLKRNSVVCIRLRKCWKHIEIPKP